MILQFSISWSKATPSPDRASKWPAGTHSLKLKVVAEGVDDEEQAKLLRLLRCDEMQGFLFSRPVPFDDLTKLLRWQ